MFKIIFTTAAEWADPLPDHY